MHGFEHYTGGKNETRREIENPHTAVPKSGFTYRLSLQHYISLTFIIDFLSCSSKVNYLLSLFFVLVYVLMYFF